MKRPPSNAPAATNDEAFAWEVEDCHSGALLEFKRLIKGNGRFSLVILQYNDLPYRDKLITHLNHYADSPIVFSVDPAMDFSAFEEGLISASQGHDLVQVLGLNEWLFGDNRDIMLKGFNYHRELLADRAPATVALWMTEYDIRDFALKAPDMWAWRKAVIDFSLQSRERDTLELAPLNFGTADLEERRQRAQEITQWLAAHLEESIPKANLLRELGEIKSQQGEAEGALQAFDSARKIFRKADYKRDYALTTGNIARVYRLQGNIVKAIDYHQEAKNLFKDLGDAWAQATASLNLADALYLTGAVEKALESYMEALKVFEALGDYGARATTLLGIARVSGDTGDLESALELQKEALVILEKLGDKRSQAIAALELARFYEEKGAEEAPKLYQDALEVFKKMGDKRSQAVALSCIAKLYTRKGDVNKALEIHKQALVLFRAVGDKLSEGISIANIAFIHHLSGRLEEALASYEEGLQLLETVGVASEVAALLRLESQIWWHKNELQKALTALTKSYGIESELGRPDGICRVGRDLGHLLCAMGEKQKGLEILKRSRDGYRQLGKMKQAAEVAEIMKNCKSNAGVPPKS